MAKKKIFMLLGDFVKGYEVMVPFQMLLMVGHQEFLGVLGTPVSAGPTSAEGSKAMGA